MAFLGLIPAHAGKTHFERTGLQKPRAHPRSRGENARAPHARTARSGSSPLTRGKRKELARLAWRPGLIPAHAGKTGGDA